MASQRELESALKRIDVPNMDGMYPRELHEYANNLRTSRQTKTVRVARAIAHTKANAMNLRSIGRIQAALELERMCDFWYRYLPKWAQW